MAHVSPLDPDRVAEIYRGCLFRCEEPFVDWAVAKGPNGNVGFHPKRLEQHAQEVGDMLDDLPDACKESSGAMGVPLSRMCTSRYGIRWADERNVEQLLLLGLALGKIEIRKNESEQQPQTLYVIKSR